MIIRNFFPCSSKDSFWIFNETALLIENIFHDVYMKLDVLFYAYFLKTSKDISYVSTFSPNISVVIETRGGISYIAQK